MIHRAAHAGESFNSAEQRENPALPPSLGSCDTPGYASAVRVSDKSAFVANGSASLRLLSFTNPVAAPALAADTTQAGMRLRIQSRRGSHYDAECTDQLPCNQWQTLQTILLTNDSTVIQIAPNTTAGFFRLKQLA